MKRAATSPRLAATLAGFLALFASGCAVPLAPGYRILKETRSVEFVPGTTPELRIRADFMLENSGNSELTFVDVALPDEKLFGLTNPRAEVDGTETAFVSLPADSQEEEPNSLRIPLDPPWKQKKTRRVQIEYTFRAPGDSGEWITLGEDNFHLAPRGWFPLPQPPKHFLAPYPKRPDRTVYTVRVPEDFLILARGAPAGHKKDGGEVEYRFDLGKRDLTPYIVAGRYTASSPRRNGAVFWTLGPLEGDPGPAEERITVAWSILEDDFGPLDKNIREPHVVESPELGGESGADAEAAITAFPGGALVNGAALAQGIGSEEFLEAVAQALAHGWFDDEIYPAPEAAVVMGEGLPEYATIAIEEAHNGEPGRRRRILYYLEEYDKARKEAAEKPLGEAMASNPPGERRIALAKAPLFFAALEDACGQAQMQGGLKQLVALMGSREANIEDLRAELELSSGKDLAELFRVWLNKKGIPEEFRERYAMPKDEPTGNRKPDIPEWSGGFESDISNFDCRGGRVREIITAEKGPKAIGPYSQAVKANGFIFTAGQVALDPVTGQMAQGGIAAETARVLENLKAVVEAAGSSLAQAVKVTVYLKDMNDFAAMNEVYARYFPKNPPARSTIEAVRLPRDARVEMDLIALA